MNPAGAGILGLLAIGAAVAGILIGLPLLLMGLRGRKIDDHPVCRKCGFDLVGFYQVGAAAKCPECGLELGPERSVRIGNRRRRRGLVGAGVVLLLGATAVVVVYGWSKAANFNWNTIKPFALLLHDARSHDLSTTDGAGTELLARLRNDTLTAEQVADTIARALELQADPTSTWSNSWGDLLEAVHQRGGLSEADLVRYVRSGMRIDFAARAKVLAGDQIPIEVRFSGPRLGGQQSVILWSQMTSLRIDGTEVELKQRLTGRHGVSRSGNSSTRSVLPAGPGPGKHAVRATIAFEERPDFKDSPARLTWTQVFEVPVEVLPAEAAMYELVQDPALEQKMRNAVEVRMLRLEGPDVSATLMFQNPPLAYAFDLILKVGDREIVGSTISGVAGAQMGWGGGIDAVGTIDAERVNVVLRPSLKAMKESMDLTKAWGQEIVVRDVVLERPEKTNQK